MLLWWLTPTLPDWYLQYLTSISDGNSQLVLDEKKFKCSNKLIKENAADGLLILVHSALQQFGEKYFWKRTSKTSFFKLLPLDQMAFPGPWFPPAAMILDTWVLVHLNSTRIRTQASSVQSLKAKTWLGVHKIGKVGIHQVIRVPSNVERSLNRLDVHLIQAAYAYLRITNNGAEIKMRVEEASVRKV